MAAQTSRLGRMSSVHAGDHPIAEAQVGERRREPIENQQLLLGEDGHNGTRPDWTGEPGNGRPGGGGAGRPGRAWPNANNLAKSKEMLRN
jgi:hypothetical protein